MALFKSLPLISKKNFRSHGLRGDSYFPIPISKANDKGEHWHLYYGKLWGCCVEVCNTEDQDLLYKMGSFGKGLLSKGAPEFSQSVITFHQYASRLRWFWLKEKKRGAISEEQHKNLLVKLNQALKLHTEQRYPRKDEVKSPMNAVDVTMTSASIETAAGDMEVLEEVDINMSTQTHDTQPKSLNLVEIWEDDDAGFWDSDSDLSRATPSSPDACKNKLSFTSNGSTRKTSASPKPEVTDGASCPAVTNNLSNTIPVSEAKTLSNENEPSAVVLTDTSRNVTTNLEDNDIEMSEKAARLQADDFKEVEVDMESELDALIISLLELVPNSEHQRIQVKIHPSNPTNLPDPYPIVESLILSTEEAFFLSFGLGCLVVEERGNALSVDELYERCCCICVNFPARYAAYQHFRSKGWIPRSGVKNGVDFVLYEQSPTRCHATYCAVIRSGTRSLLDEPLITDHPQLCGLTRATDDAHKSLLITYVIWPSDIRDLKSIPLDQLTSAEVQEILISRITPSSEVLTR